MRKNIVTCRILSRIEGSATKTKQHLIQSILLLQDPLVDRKLCYEVLLQAALERQKDLQDPLPDRWLCYNYTQPGSVALVILAGSSPGSKALLLSSQKWCGLPALACRILSRIDGSATLSQATKYVVERYILQDPLPDRWLCYVVGCDVWYLLRPLAGSSLGSMALLQHQVP